DRAGPVQAQPGAYRQRQGIYRPLLRHRRASPDRRLPAFDRVCSDNRIEHRL
ncbi:MAG: Mobile element protein, partial [Olavius algarvensis Gamma 1 endosymbiont]